MKAIGDFIDTLEQTGLASCKSLPALPADIKEFFVKIMPAISLILAIVYGIALLSALSAYMRTGDFTYWMGARIYYGPMYWLGLIFEAIMVYFTARSFPRLGVKAYEGWRWFFIGQLALVISFVLSGHFGGLIGIALTLYILFQIHGYYGSPTEPA